MNLTGVPEMMAVRAKLLPENGLISQIAMSAMDNWGGEIKEQAVPVLVIIEGLTMYLSEADVQRIFAVISGRFHPDGCAGRQTPDHHHHCRRNAHHGL